MKNQTSSAQTVQRFNQDAWRFGVQVFFSSIVLGLCIFKLAIGNDERNIALYWGGLSSVLAYWLPAPGLIKTDKEQPSITQRTFATTSDGDGHGLSQLSETKVESDSGL